MSAYRTPADSPPSLDEARASFEAKMTALTSILRILQPFDAVTTLDILRSVDAFWNLNGVFSEPDDDEHEES